MDAIKAFEGPVREVHISNIHATGGCQRHSKPSPTGDLRIRTVRLHRGDAGTAEMKRFAIDSRSDRGAYFSSGGYDLLLAPFRGVR